MTTFDCSELCRLCLVKDRVKVPIFEGEGDARQVSFKIGTCLPIKVTREDRFPKQVCEDCINKLDLVYDFWTTTVNSERQLSQWVGDAGDGEDKQGYVSITDELMKQETAENRLMEGSVMNQNDQNTNININMMDQMGLTMPIIISNNQQQQQQQHQQMTMQGVSGTSSDANQRGNKRHHEEVEASDDEGDIEGLDNDDAVKSEDIDGTSNRPTGHEPTFVSIACDDGAGPSGLQQQKMDMSDMIMTQADVDPKSGCTPEELLYHQKTDLGTVEYQLYTLAPLHEDDEDGETAGDIYEIINHNDEGEAIHITKACLIHSQKNFTSTTLKASLLLSRQANANNLLEQANEKEFDLHDNSQSNPRLENDLEMQNTPPTELFKVQGELDEDHSENGLEIHDEVEMEKSSLKDLEIHENNSDDLELPHNHPEPTKSHIKSIKKHNPQKTYKCDKCGKVMRKKLQFQRHLKLHEKHVGGKCQECDLTFPDAEKLQKHMIKVHQEATPFPCQICGKPFKTEEFLKIHTKQHNKRFTCDICGISKVSGYDLRLHKKKHNQEYVTFCKTCGKGFYTNQTLERHMLTHTGEKRFICKICKTAYSSSTYLNTHMKSHKKQREKHKCAMCDFESYWKAALKVHLKIHSGDNQFTCEICGKCVSSKNYLQVHMRIHTGEKPHVCEICGRAFSVKKYLMVHLRTHTGEKPFECKHCEKRFTQQGSLNSHIKLHNTAAAAK